MPPRRLRMNRRKRAYVRRVRAGRALRRKIGMNLGIHRFKRLGTDLILSNDNTNAPVWTSQNATLVQTPNYADDFGTYALGGAFRFMLNGLLEYNDFTQLFDRYKITGIKLKVMFQCNQSGTPGGTRAPLPLMTYAFDCDDANAPANGNIVRVKQYAKQRILNGSSSFNIFIKPRITKALYANALTAGYSSEAPTWIDATRADIEHYGLKFWINNWFADHDTSSYKLTITPTYYFSCKDTQ